MEIDVIEAQKQYTNQNIIKIQSAIEGILASLPDEIAGRFSIVMTGSYGRCEASQESDLDVFTIVDSKDIIKPFRAIARKLNSAIRKIVPKNPGKTGTFGFKAVISIDQILKDIAGVNDTNKNITRRMLMLLEGKALINHKKFTDYRKKLLEAYIKTRVDSGQMAFFFLNDIIRYWRTMATDYESKTTDDDRNWGVRSIKLRFSRKLIYFSGIITAAETVDGSHAVKINRVVKLLDQCPIDRIQEIGQIYAPELTGELIEHYRYFINEISKPDVRTTLDNMHRNNRVKNKTYIELRNRGRLFSECLANLLKSIYPPEHQIHSAMLF